MLIDQARMEQSLEYLAQTDVEYANAKSLFDGLNEQRKVVKANCYMRSGQGTAGAKEQDAYRTPMYIQHLAKMEVAQQAFLTLQAKRITEGIFIDCWRSLNAARGRGQMV